MPITLNLQGKCDDGSARGTGVPACTKEFGQPDGFDLYAKGWNLSTVTDNILTQADYESLIKSGELFNFNSAFDFDDLSAENGKETSSRGVKKTNLLGLPEMSFTFVDGYCFHKNAYDKLGYNRWDIALKYDNGMLFATDVAGSVIKGFDTGDFDVATFKNQKGNDSNKTTVMFQFKNAQEYNLRGVFYTWEELGYDARQIAGVLNALVDYVATPVAGDTEVNVTVVNDCNGSVNVQGLTATTNWVLGGTQATATTITAVAYVPATNSYTLTLDNALAAADTVQVALADTVNGYASATNASGDSYSGVASLVTV